MPTGRVRRTALPAAVLLRSGAAQALAAARALTRGETSAREILADERLAASAERAARTMGEMKGAVMKIGQLLSFVDSEFIPPAYRDALATLQADAPPMAQDLVDDVITRELGAPPASIFSFFSPNPIAAASIGQVHMARLPSPAGGDEELELVVKVQYPGVAEAIASDLSNAALLSMLGSFAKVLLKPIVADVDISAIVDEVRERVTEELDYRIELANQQEFIEIYRDHPSIHIPEVVPELSTERVLTMEYVDAMRWPAALEQPKELRDQWGLNIARFAFHSLYEHHLFNADPHPGNYLFHEDGSVTFLDFGCVKHFTRERIQGMRDIAAAVYAGDDDRALDGFVAIGMLRNRDGLAEDTMLGYIHRAYEPLRSPQPYTYTREWAAAQMGDLLDLKLSADERNIVRHVDLPPDQVFVLRISAGLNSVLAGLEATLNWDDLGAELGLR
jgi:predicted unusual protein kinase regulating ubiquinone biosynthesis (AarF/ABC1/UbiB family)